MTAARIVAALRADYTSTHYHLEVEWLGAPALIMKSAHSVGATPREGYCTFVSLDMGLTRITVAAHQGWTPTTGDLLFAARMVPMMTAEVEP